MDELLEQFLLEARDLIAAVSADLESLAGGDAGREALERAFRAVHTLKGSVAIFGFTAAERVLHGAEDVLGRARTAQAPLDRAMQAAVVAVVDQVDRWVDAVERTGSLGDDADAIAASLVRGLAPEESRVGADTALAPSSAPWLDALRQRAGAEPAQGRGLTAFRYVPDPDCFFRGEDPLAIAAAVPGLTWLELSPAAGAWPELAAIEPFTCVSVLEGLSIADRAEVHAALRLQGEQVELAEIEPAPVGPEPAGAVKSARTLRVETERVDGLADRLGDLLVAVDRFRPLVQALDPIDPALAARARGALGDVDRAAADLGRAVVSVRSVPLGPALRRLSRSAREIAGVVGKPVEFTIEGGGLEADKQIADGLYEPLLHLLRNAIDHGIEAAEARVAAGKPVAGRVRLSFRRELDSIEAVLADDGGGMDAAAIRRAAVERGLLPATDADALDDEAALRLIFAPGFSTAGAVTGISGRGVGMGAVSAAVEALRGTIAIDSRPGAGTAFRMRIPVSALTTRLLVIEAGGDRYGVALDQVVETVRLPGSAIQPVGQGHACVLRGRTVPVLSLARLLDHEERPDGVARLLVVDVAGHAVALRIDAFGQRIDTAVRPAAGLLAGIPGILGSALMGDGGVLLVLDLAALAA